MEKGQLESKFPKYMLCYSALLYKNNSLVIAFCIVSHLQNIRYLRLLLSPPVLVHMKQNVMERGGA